MRRLLGSALSLALGLLLGAPSLGVAQAKPDLVVTAVGDPPATALPGGSFTISATVTNQGTAAAAASTTKFNLVSSSGSTKKNLKGVQIIADLAPGGSDGPTVTVAVYSDTAPGTYFLQACADGSKAVAEANETNNCKNSTGTITVLDTPDLVVTSITDPPATAGQGESIKVTDTVKNVGAVPAAASTTKYSLVSTATGAKKDLKGTQAVPFLDPAQTFTEEETVVVRSDTAPGYYRLQACADGGKVVVESSENDNCLTSGGTIRVTAQADLGVISVTVSGAPVSVAPKGTVVITSVVKNQGLGDAGPSTTKFSLVDTTTGAKKNLKGTQAVPALAGGATDSEQTTLTVYSDTLPGTYTVQACADSSKAVKENSENNNCATSVDTVTVH